MSVQGPSHGKEPERRGGHAENDFRFLNPDREGATSAASAHRESSLLIMRQIPFLIEIFLMKRGFPLDP